MNRIIYSFFNGGCSGHIFNYYIFKRSKKESNIYFNFLTFLERKKLRLVEGNIIKHRIFKKRKNYQCRGDNKEWGRENKKKGEIITKSEIRGMFKNKYLQKKNWLQKEYK